MTSKLHRRGIAAGTAMLTMLGMLGIASPASADPAGPYQIWLRHSIKCVDNANGSTVDSTPVHQWSCAWHGSDWNATFQKWTFEWTDNGYARIRNEWSGKCLNVQGRSTADGAAVIQFTCGRASGNDEWYGEYLYRDSRTGEDWYRLRARHSGKCLDVTGGPDAIGNGVRLQQFSCLAGQINQQMTWKELF
jgi:hypothetical protein